MSLVLPCQDYEGDILQAKLSTRFIDEDKLCLTIREEDQTPSRVFLTEEQFNSLVKYVKEEVF